MTKQKAANDAAQAKALFVEADSELDLHLQLAPESWRGLCIKAMLAAYRH